MKKYVNGKYIEMSEAEILKEQEQSELYEKEYWQSADYGEAINSEIRKKYSESQEFAILRQAKEKPSEYAEYFAYCENCKSYVKQQKQKYGGDVG